MLLQCLLNQKPFSSGAMTQIRRKTKFKKKCDGILEQTGGRHSKMVKVLAYRPGGHGLKQANGWILLEVPQSL